MEDSLDSQVKSSKFLNKVCWLLKEAFGEGGAFSWGIDVLKLQELKLQGDSM